MAFASKKIAVDTSALLQRKNVLEKIRGHWGNRIEIVVPQQVSQELKALAGKNRKNFLKVRLIEKQEELFKVKEKKVEAQNADEALKKLGREGFAIVSLDRELQQAVRKEKGTLIELRGNSFKIMEE